MADIKKNLHIPKWLGENRQVFNVITAGQETATIQSMFTTIEDLEKAMATHSSLLAWEIPWTEEPGGLPSTGLQRVGDDFSD